MRVTKFDAAGEVVHVGKRADGLQWKPFQDSQTETGVELIGWFGDDCAIDAICIIPGGSILLEAE